MSLSRGMCVAAMVLLGALPGASAQGRGLPASGAVLQGPDASTVRDGVYTKSQADRGKRAYADGCGSCHLDDLSGTDRAPALVGDAFLTTWDGLTVADLAERIRTTMPQDGPGTLSAETTADVVAYLLQVNEFPQGTGEMTPEIQRLRSIRIVRK